MNKHLSFFYFIKINTRVLQTFGGYTTSFKDIGKTKKTKTHGLREGVKKIHFLGDIPLSEGGGSTFSRQNSKELMVQLLTFTTRDLITFFASCFDNN